MRFSRYFAACTLVLLTACGGGASHDPTGPAPGPVPAIALTATAPSVMRQGAAVDIGATLKGLGGPVTWSLATGAPGTLTEHADKLGATYTPVSSPPDAALEKVTITASAGGVSQSIQLDLKPAPKPVSYLTLPKVWTYGPLGDWYPIRGNPVASAVDQSGNLYLAYSAPVSEIKKVGTDGSITTFAHVGNPGSLAFGSNGVLYVVDSVGSGAYAIRLIAPDGTISILTQTAPFDSAKGTVDGPSGVATAAAALSIVVAPNGTVYATDLTRVRKIAPDGSFSTFAGGGCEYFGGLDCPAPAVDGHGTEARFIWPSSIAIDAVGNLYVKDHRAVRKITPAGDVSTLAGIQGPVAISDSPDLDGTGSAARFSGIQLMAMDPAGNIYVLGGRLLRKITPSGVVSTVATGVGDFFPMAPERNITSLYAGVPGVVVLLASNSLSKVTVD